MKEEEEREECVFTHEEITEEEEEEKKEDDIVGLGGGGGGVYSQANLQRFKPNSLSRGPVAGLLCLVGEDYNPTLQDLTLGPVCVFNCCC